MERIGFLSFGHWGRSRGSQTPTAGDALTQTIELAVAAEELGIDGAYARVHHFARQISSPFPLLAAMAARTSRIELGTGIIDMRYEQPRYMAEAAASADLISGGRLQLGLSRGSPEPAVDGARHFGMTPADGQTDADMAREHTAAFRSAIAGERFAEADPKMAGMAGRLPIEPQSPGLGDRVWWGSGSRPTAVWAAQQGMNLMSSTLLLEDTGTPFHELQHQQILLFREAWAEAGWARTPRVSVSRSVLPITSDLDRQYFGRGGGSDQVGVLDGVLSRFGKSYVGEPDAIVEELRRDSAVRAADTLLLTVPNQLGVEYNARLLETVARDIAPALGWTPATERDAAAA
ncbi:LLM class flavin-dependent oxidoreductase [Patulibacter sp. NPDC049589]|uniref:LLM class flavin-dependent oxidoreductase n=1 Tax=Patulibacter sp. NPDC049589 TaxID=3154731 RepID=UPI003440BBB1